MNDLSLPPIGHNNPPEHLTRADAILAPFTVFLDEAANWLDGVPVETEDQLEDVDMLLSNVKAAEKALLQARDAATKPLHDLWKAKVAHWKGAVDDLELLKKGLARISNDFKVKLTDLREAEARRVRADAEKSMRAAKDLAIKADPADIRAVRVADAARRDAEEAMRGGPPYRKDPTKRHQNRAEMGLCRRRGPPVGLALDCPKRPRGQTEFIDDYVARNYRTKQMDGVKVWDEREAY